MGHGRHFQHRPAKLIKVRAGKFGQVLPIGNVNLVEHDDARAFHQRHVPVRRPQVALVLRQFIFDRLEVADRVAVVFDCGCVEDVDNHCTALNVAQELQAQALALRSAGDQAWNVRHCETHTAGFDHSQIRDQRGERVVSDLRTCRRHGGNDRGFTGRRVAHQGDIGNGFEFKDDVARLAGLPQ